MNSKKATEGVMNQYSISEKCLKRVYHFAKEEYDKLTIIMIYPNSKYDVNDDNYSLMEMLHILFKAKMTTHEKKRQLEENYVIMMTKKKEREVEGLCNLSQVFIEDGFIKGQSNIVLNLMKKTKQTINEVMDSLDIEDIYPPKITDFINQQNAKNEN